MEFDILLDQLEKIILSKAKQSYPEDSQRSITTKPSFDQPLEQKSGRQSFKWTQQLDIKFCIVAQALGWCKVAPSTI